jgi:hypothetical protein
MFERELSRPPVTGAGRAALDADTLTRWIDSLVSVGRDLADAERIDLIRGLEELKAAAAGAQAVLTADFDASQRRTQTDAGTRSKDLGKGIVHQVALARRESPHRAQIHVAWPRP